MRFKEVLLGKINDTFLFIEGLVKKVGSYENIAETNSLGIVDKIQKSEDVPEDEVVEYLYLNKLASMYQWDLQSAYRNLLNYYTLSVECGIPLDLNDEQKRLVAGLSDNKASSYVFAYVNGVIEPKYQNLEADLKTKAKNSLSGMNMDEFKKNILNQYELFKQEQAKFNQSNKN